MRRISLTAFRRLYENGMLEDVVVYTYRGESVLMAKSREGQSSNPQGYEVVETKAEVVRSV